MTQRQKYLIEKLMLTITSMGYQGELIGAGNTTTPTGVARTERLQNLKMKAYKFLFELEDTIQMDKMIMDIVKEQK